MKGAAGRCAILLLTVCTAGCASAPTRPESVGRDDYAKVAEYVSALVRHDMNHPWKTGAFAAAFRQTKSIWVSTRRYEWLTI